jgi:hypothetical protein
MTRTTIHRGRGLLGLAALLAAILLLAAPPARAQDDDPYGGTTTTTEPELVPECKLDVTAGAPGVRARVRITNAPPRATVRVLLGGDEVARGTAPEDGSALEIPFTVPDVAPDRYLVTAVGADFTVTCAPGDGTFGVLGQQVSRLPGVFGVTGLPRTGIYAALFVVIALVLIVAGRAMLSASRRRKEAERRARSRRRSADRNRTHVAH